MTELTPPLSAEDHVDGPDRAELELVMFGDFQCPYSAAAHPIVRRSGSAAGRLLFAFRHFPLRDVHPDAQRAAEASEAAGAQGAFWEMHDALFESRGALGREDLIHHATGLGLDVQRFTASSTRGATLHASSAMSTAAWPAVSRARPASSSAGASSAGRSTPPR